ncbi:MAG: FumA C-terminus/TtdB family hydratase beta subunit [Deltaproteobacteria bacterium]|jgi:fumarate hydratase subunit beta|nr:FumA C-terminus/TtdB family hydratase beta subunit [Deltaproteobacteria bacterium]
MPTYEMSAPLSDADARKLRSGDVVFLNGIIYTARDAAHKKLNDLLDEGKELPIDLKGAVIYYVGPSPAQPGYVIGSAGPTTSYRMDAFAPRLHSLGAKASIGKGIRNEAVKKALKDYGGVYFGATGGAGALLSACIKEAEVVAFPEMGPEALRRLRVERLPLLVINDSVGGELYVQADLKAVGLA